MEQPSISVPNAWYFSNNSSCFSVVEMNWSPVTIRPILCFKFSCVIISSNFCNVSRSASKVSVYGILSLKISTFISWYFSLSASITSSKVSDLSNPPHTPQFITKSGLYISIILCVRAAEFTFPIPQTQFIIFLSSNSETNIS